MGKISEFASNKEERKINDAAQSYAAFFLYFAFILVKY